MRSPLDEAELTKAEIRELARREGLPTWDEPASACLSSRIPYHREVTGEKLHAIEAAESALRDLGFRVCRVRHHDEVARIEIGADELARALDAGEAPAHRPGLEGRRLSPRHARSPGLSHRQPQRALRCDPLSRQGRYRPGARADGARKNEARTQDHPFRSSELDGYRHCSGHPKLTDRGKPLSSSDYSRH